MWVRGLKQLQSVCHVAHLPSHPMWVRGLKLKHAAKINKM